MLLWILHPMGDNWHYPSTARWCDYGPPLTPNPGAFYFSIHCSLWALRMLTCFTCNSSCLWVSPSLKEIHVNRLLQSRVINDVVSLGTGVWVTTYKLFDLGQASASHSKLWISEYWLAHLIELKMQSWVKILCILWSFVQIWGLLWSLFPVPPPVFLLEKRKPQYPGLSAQLPTPVSVTL